MEEHYAINSAVCVCYPTLSKMGIKNNRPIRIIEDAGHILCVLIDKHKKIVSETHVDFIGDSKHLKEEYNAEIGESSRTVEPDNIVEFRIKRGKFFTHAGRAEYDLYVFRESNI